MGEVVLQLVKGCLMLGLSRGSGNAYGCWGEVVELRVRKLELLCLAWWADMLREGRRASESRFILQRKMVSSYLNINRREM